MLSKTLTHGVRGFKKWSKKSGRRLKKKLGLVQLGEHTGLSAALLSKIERGNLFPTLPTLLRIAMVFGIGLEHFFVESDENSIAQIRRKAERVRLPNRSAEPPSYFFESLNFDVKDRTVDLYHAEFPAGSEPSDSHQHAGTEFIYIVGGGLIVTIEEEAIVLDEG